ncbi:MAG: hypothetical protein ACLR06_15490 [Christensenellaceae bacterium]
MRGYGQKLVYAEFVAAVKPFRDYYGYTEPNVVTKCFAASDGKFVLRDVCVFVAADGTLRIAADIRHGFCGSGTIWAVTLSGGRKFPFRREINRSYA